MFRKGFFLTILLITYKNYKKMQSFTFKEEIFIEDHTNIDYDHAPYYKMVLKVVPFMNEQFVQEILEKLKKGELSEFYVKKEEFMVFRQVLVKRDDFKHFRGIGQRGGDVLYHYLQEPRS